VGEKGYPADPIMAWPLYALAASPAAPADTVVGPRYAPAYWVTPRRVHEDRDVDPMFIRGMAASAGPPLEAAEARVDVMVGA
jgi:hypothetical protein